MDENNQPISNNQFNQSAEPQMRQPWQQPEQPQPTAQDYYNNSQSGFTPPVMDKKKSDKSFLILVIIGIVLAVGILIFTFVNNGNFLKKEDKEDQPAQVGSGEFEDLTKEEAIAFLKTQDGVRGILPDGYVGEEITSAVIMNGNVHVSDIRLIYSYSNLEELKQMAHRQFYGYDHDDYEDDFQIKEYDYYAIVTPNRAINATSCDRGLYNECDSVLSFKSEYFNYYRSEKTYEENGTTATEANDVAYMITRDPEIVNYILRVFTFFSSVGGSSSYGNIYSYDFEEQDDKFVLTVNNVGAGANMDLYKHGGKIDTLAINLYRRRFVASKSDGLVYTVRINDDGWVMDYIKSIPITEEEFNSLPGYGSN